jgi:hypothetical protein
VTAWRNSHGVLSTSLANGLLFVEVFWENRTEGYVCKVGGRRLRRPPDRGPLDSPGAATEYYAGQVKLLLERGIKELTELEHPR